MKYCKLGGLEQWKYIVSQIEGARNPKSVCPPDHVPSEAYGREFFPASSGFWCLPEMLPIPWFVDASL